MAFTAPIPVKTTDAANEMKFVGRVPYWVPHLGIEIAASATAINYNHSFCDVKSMDNPTLEAINEETIQDSGKYPFTDYDGVKIADFTMTFKGNAHQAAASLLGISLQQFNEIDWTVYKKTFTGSLILNSYTQDSSANTDTQSSMLLFGLDVATKQLQGITDPKTELVVTFSAENARAYTAKAGTMWNVGMFYDNGTVINAAAPDAALLTFANEDANPAGGTVVPLALSRNTLDNVYTDYREFYLALLDGVEVPPADITSTVGTGVTFGTAPAAQTKLLLFYIASTATLFNAAAYNLSWQQVNV